LAISLYGPIGVTIKTGKGLQRELDKDGNFPDKRKFVAKFFSNLSPEQSDEGVKNQVLKDYNDSDCNEEVEVHVLKFAGKTQRNNKKTAFTVLVVPKVKGQKIPDILQDKYETNEALKYDSIMCRNWGGTIPEDLQKYVPVTEHKYATMS